MGLFSKAKDIGKDIFEEGEDVGTQVARRVSRTAKQQAPIVARRAKKVGRGVFKRAVRPVASETYENVLRPGYKDYIGIQNRVGAEFYMWKEHPETIPFNPFISREEADRIKHERGLSTGLGGFLEDMFTDAGRKRVEEKGFEGAPGYEKLAFQVMGDPLTWTGVGAVGKATARGLAAGSVQLAAKEGAKEALMQTGIPSVVKLVTSPTRLPGMIARGRGARLEVAIDAAAEAIKDTSSIRFTNLNRLSRQEELARLDDWKNIAAEIKTTGTGTSKLDGQTYTASQLRDVYDNWTQSERIVTGGGLDNADYLRSLRDNRPLQDVYWMTNVAREARTALAHEGEDLSTVEKLSMKVPGFRNVLRGIAPARYSGDPVFRTYVQRAATIHNMRTANGVFETLLSMDARAAGMLRDPIRGTVKGVTARGKLEPTVQNILQRPDLFDLPDKTRDVVEATRAAQRAVGRSIGEQALTFNEANPGIISKEDLKWYRLLAEGKDNYVHRKVAWATSVPEGAQRYLEGTYEPNVIRRLAARMRFPVARIKGVALPPGFKAVNTTPQGFGVRPSIAYERVVESAADAKNVLYSNDPGVILADYNNQLFQKFLDDTVYGPLLKSMRIDPNALVNSKFDSDIHIVTRSKSKLGRLNAALKGVTANRAISRRTIAYLRDLARDDDIPEPLRIALEGDVVRGENLLDAMHARDVSANEMARRLRAAGEELEDLGDVKAFEAEALRGIQPEPERLSVWKKVAQRIRGQGRRAQEIAEEFNGEPLYFRGTPVFHHTTSTFSGLPTEGVGPLGRGAYVTSNPEAFAAHAEGVGGRVYPLVLTEDAAVLDFTAPIPPEVITRVSSALPKDAQKAFTTALRRNKTVSGTQLQNAIFGALGIKRTGAGVTPSTGMNEFSDIMKAAGIDAIKGGADQFVVLNPDKMRSMFETADKGPTILDDLVTSHRNLLSQVRVRMEEVRAAFDASDAELRSLRADKAAAKVAATKGSWSMRQVTTPGLSGWYDEQVGQSIMQYFGNAPQGDNVLQQATLLQAIPQSLMAGADISASLLQTVVVAFANPVGWLKGLGYGISSFTGLGNRFYAGYLRGLARAIEPTSGKSWLELATRGNLSMSGTELFDASEYLHAIGASGRKLSAVAEFVANMPQNRAFAIQRNVATMELFKAQVGLEQALTKGVLSDENLKSIARQVDLATGVVSSQKLGVMPAQASAERLFGRFGVQWFRSQTGRLVQAVRVGGMDGRVARRLLTQQIAGMLGMYVATTTLLGQEPDLDPTSRNFLTFTVGKSRIRPGGIFVSTVRTFAQTVEAVANGDEERLAHIRQGDNPILNYWRNGAPVIGGLMADEILDVNADASYRADEYGQFDPRRYAPFSVQAAINPSMQNPTLLDRFIAGGSSAVGLTETPQTATDVWKAVTQQYATENGFAKWDAIPAAQQEEIINQNPEIRDAKAAVDKWFEKRGDTPLNAAMKQNEQSRRAMGDVLAGAWARVQTGQMAKSEWRQLYADWSGKHAYLSSNVFDSLPPGARKELDKEPELLQDKLAALYQAIQPVDADDDGEIDEADWKEWRARREQFWVEHPEAQQFSDYIQFQYPVRTWEKLDNPVMKEADAERRHMSDRYDEYLRIPKYRGLSLEDGDFLDALISAKAAASREIGAMLAERGVPPERIRVPAKLAWKYVLQQLNQSGMQATPRNQQLLRLAIAVSADDKKRLQILSPERLNFLKQNAAVLDWYPSALRDTGLSTNMLVRLGVIQQPQGESVAERAAAMIG